MYKNLKKFGVGICMERILMEIFSGNFWIELGNCDIGYILLVYDSD